MESITYPAKWFDFYYASRLSLHSTDKEVLHKEAFQASLNVYMHT
jgi:hypothetical protein